MHEPPSPGRHSARLSAPVPGAALSHDDAAPEWLASADDGIGDERVTDTVVPPRSRLRIGFGAALVLVVVALVVAVLVSILAPLGRTEVVARAGGAAGAGVGASAGSAAPTGGAVDAGRPQAAAGASGAQTAGAGTSTAVPSILVHVLGAVARPGLYQLHRGDRVVDAVTAAGGFTEVADQTRQNLARVVADGEQIVVPAVGEMAQGGAGAGGSGSGGSAGSSGGSGGAAPAGPINLNTADEPTLETLPHVGPALAQRILDWRAANGAFTSVDDLKNVAGIGDKTFADLKDLVTV